VRTPEQQAHQEPALGNAFANDLLTQAGAGAPLDPDVAERLGAAMGHDFSHVFVHTGESAQRACEEHGANAFTKGSHLYFAAGQFDPDSTTGEALLRHELFHVIQGDTGRVDGVSEGHSEPSDRVEREARAQSMSEPGGERPGPFPERRDGPILRDPDKDADEEEEDTRTSVTALNGSIVSATGGGHGALHGSSARGGHGSHVSASAQGGQLIVNGPTVEFKGTGVFHHESYKLDGQSLFFGGTQTLDSSTRIAVYTWGGVPESEGGKVVAEAISTNGGKIDRVGKEGPFYDGGDSDRMGYLADTPGAATKTARLYDSPGWGALPLHMSGGSAVRTKGSDNFTSAWSFTLAGGAPYHGACWNWSVPWAMTLSGSGHGTGEEITENPTTDHPSVLDGVPANQAGESWVRFTSPSAAAGAPMSMLLPKLLIAREKDLVTYQSICAALKSKTATVKIHVSETASTIGEDELVVSATGHRTVRRGEVDVGNGGEVTHTLGFFELFTPENINSGSGLTVIAQDQGSLYSNLASTYFPFPFTGRQSMCQDDGTYAAEVWFS